MSPILIDLLHVIQTQAGYVDTEMWMSAFLPHPRDFPSHPGKTKFTGGHRNLMLINLFLPIESLWGINKHFFHHPSRIFTHLVVALSD